MFTSSLPQSHWNTWKKKKIMANVYKYKTGKVPIRGPEPPGNCWLLSQGESTEGRSQKALGQTKEHGSTTGTSPPLMDTGWKGKQHLPGTVIVSAKDLCPQTNTFTAVPMEGVPAHLSPPKHHPPAREEETQMEGRVESLAEEIKLWLHNLYTSVKSLPNVQSRTFSTSVNDTWSPQIWGKSTA